MKRLFLGSAVALVAAMTIGGGAPPVGVSIGQVQAAPTTPQPETPAPQPAERQAAIAQRRVVEAGSLRRIQELTFHKNRAPGERAHRRWRIRRAAGKAA